MKATFLKALCLYFLLGSYAQAATVTQTTLAAPKVDILFVIDNSASMASSQNMLIQSIPAFIQKLNMSILDYRIAVTTTDAYYYQQRLLSGNRYENTGYFFIDRNTPQNVRVFSVIANQGIYGNGDERTFRSFKEVLNFGENSDFRRPDAKLAILNLSDEDDFSHAAPDLITDYNDPRLTPVADFADFLAKQSGPAPATFSTISILDGICLKQLDDGGSVKRIGHRYSLLADATGGIKGSLCSIESSLMNYADFLGADIGAPPAYTITLDHTPIVETIAVRVNGRLLAQDAVNGWTYDAASKTLTLHGTAVPNKGDLVSVTYDYEN